MNFAAGNEKKSIFFHKKFFFKKHERRRDGGRGDLLYLLSRAHQPAGPRCLCSAYCLINIRGSREYRPLLRSERKRGVKSKPAILKD